VKRDSNSKGRLKIAAVLAMCLVAVLAMSSLAYAATVASQFPAPGATIYGQPGVVSAQVFGATLNPKTAAITIDGNAVKTSVTLGEAQGKWTLTQTQPGGPGTPWVSHADHDEPHRRPDGQGHRRRHHHGDLGVHGGRQPAAGRPTGGPAQR
jgi:hypothetical protein